MRLILAILLFSSFLSGCSNVPIRDGELVIDANTSACMEDAGIASLNRKF